jgi:hypothetical protein
MFDCGIARKFTVLPGGVDYRRMARGSPIFLIDGGLSSSQVAQNAMIAYNLDMDRAAWLVSGAIVRYCPWDEGK